MTGSDGQDSGVSHSELRRETSGIIIDNYNADGGVEWYGRDLRYGNDENWICECGASFATKQAAVSHINNIGVAKKDLGDGE